MIKNYRRRSTQSLVSPLPEMWWEYFVASTSDSLPSLDYDTKENTT